MKNLLILATLLVAFSFYSCSKSNNDDVNLTGTNSLDLYFDNMVGSDELILGSKTYTNASNESFTVTTFNYFISNIVIKKSDGTDLKFPDQYFLVRQADDNSKTITLKDVPAGDYTQVSFVVGVDSLKSISDVSARTGVLDPSSYGTDNMYWAWNSGYIFMKMEGRSPASKAPTQTFKFHTGGFGGKTGITPNNLKTITLPFGDSKATVRSNIAPEVHLAVDALKVFGSNIKISENNERMSPVSGVPVAENYKSMFTVEHIHNDKM